MTGDPPVVIRLNGLLAATRIAHEAIYDLHAELTARARAAARADELLAESAGITLRRVPELTDQARGLAKAWREQAVLDPEAAGTTLSELEVEFERVEAEVGHRLAHQREIARELQSLRDPPA